MEAMEISEPLQKAYDEQYDESMRSWRESGAKTKVDNIVELAANSQLNKVLEVGSGDGSILKELEKRNFCSNLYSLEISISGIEQIKKLGLKSLVEVKHFGGYEIPYPDDFFDLVICSHVIEHVEFPRMLLREIMRVSKNHLFEIPIDFSFSVDKKVSHFLSYGHINIYTPFLFRFLLKSEGFCIVKDKKGFYSYENMKLQVKNNKIKLAVFCLKKLIISMVPKLKDYKPQTYTVLVSKSKKKLGIM